MLALIVVFLFVVFVSCPRYCYCVVVLYCLLFASFCLNDSCFEVFVYVCCVLLLLLFLLCWFRCCARFVLCHLFSP